MVDTIAQIVLDICFFGGFVLLFMGMSNRYRKHRLKLIFMGIVLILLGVFFIDWAAVKEAGERGAEAARNIIR